MCFPLVMFVVCICPFDMSVFVFLSAVLKSLAK